MFKKIKEFLAKRKQLKIQREKLKKMQRYYTLLKEGSVFMRFIYNDIEEMKKNQFNRAGRRRFQKQLAKDGIFNAEMIQHYSQKVDNVLQYVNAQLKRKK